MDFKEIFMKELPIAVQKHRDKVWERGRADLTQLIKDANEVLQKHTKGALGVNLAEHGSVDNYVEMRVHLWDMGQKKLLGLIDRYLVPSDGCYPLVLILEGSPGMPAPQGQIGDKEGLQLRFLHLLADVQSKLIQVISDKMPHNVPA